MSNMCIRRFFFALISILPIVIVAYLQGRADRYALLVEKYECDRANCEADFDGDGRPGRLFIDYERPAPNFDSWFVVEDSGRQLLKQARRSFDRSLRTHVAVIKESPSARLIIYDHIRDGGPARNVIFGYDASGKMIEVPSTKTDEDVLAALAGTDDAGTRNRWLLFQFLIKPALFFYLMALIAFAWYRRKRPTNVRTSELRSRVRCPSTLRGIVCRANQDS